MVDRVKAIDRATKLRSQMDSEQKLGNSEAAEAFATAMQRLMLEHELNDIELDAALKAGSTVPQEPIIERPVDFHAARIPYKSARSASMERLAEIVGTAHLCRILVRPRSNQVWFVGTAKHVEVAEYMFITLHKALNTITKRSYWTYRDKGGREPNYMASFKNGFLSRLGERYRLEREQVAKEHDEANKPIDVDGGTLTELTTSTALIRLNNAVERVASYIDSKYGGRKSRAGYVGGRRGHNRDGREAGTAAADSINLRANALGHGPSQKQLK